MRKGDLVKVRPQVIDSRGSLGDRYARRYCASRPITKEEQSEWYESDASKGMNDAGESKLPPTCVSIYLYEDRVYTVLRARARPRLGWGNPSPGMTEILCSVTGARAFIKRGYLEVITLDACKVN